MTIEANAYAGTVACATAAVYPSRDDAAEFQPWSAQEQALIRAHRVGQDAVVPAALAVTRVLEAVAGSGDRFRLHGLIFHMPMGVEDALTLAGEAATDGSHTYRLSRLDADGTQQLAVDIQARPVGAEPAVGTPADPIPDEAEPLDVVRFYETLANAGNTFLPALRLLTGLRRHGQRIEFQITASAAPAAAYWDACLHALLALPDTRADSAHVIQGIDSIDAWAPLAGPLSATGWLLSVHARGFVADLQIRDSAGRVVAEVRGVDYVTRAQTTASLLVAGNVSLEPFQEAYDCLAQGAGLRSRLAGFDQLHQTLLDPAGPATDVECREVLLLVDLSQWDEPDQLQQSQAYHEALAAGAELSSLPNHMQVLGLNRYETDYLYEEIYDDRSYLRDNIVLEDDDVVLDIGANIGLFSLYMLDVNPSVRVLAFEPSPITAAVARANLEGRGQAAVFQEGIAEAEGSAVFTHYTTSTVFSGFHVDAEDDRRAIEQVIENQLTDALVDDQPEVFVQDLVAQRLEGHQVEVRLTSVSDVIDRHGLTSIGLLKVDAEKSEDAILRGIRAEHWPRIRQLMLEVHDQEGTRTAQIVRFLESMGYTVVLREEEKLRQSGLYALSATRSSSKRMPSLGRNARGLQARCAELLDSIRAFRQHSSKPLTLVLASSHPASATSSHMRRQYRQAIAGVKRAAATLPGVNVATQREVLERYALTRVDTAFAKVEDASVPFPMEWYAATALWALRRHSLRWRALKKVLVVDCDNTLWRGLCAEDGPRGVSICPALQRWQAFLIAQRRAGVILCLCSRNVPEDVWAVFEQNPDMLLRAEDIALAKIGWEPKSELIAEIAADLDLAINSLVFVDDNAAECLQVSLAHPDVSCLKFPEQAQEIDQFLHHTWELDLLRTTSGGGDRVKLYQEEGERKAFKRSRAGLEEFVEGLAMEVELETITPTQIARVAELAQRTNQFNLHARLCGADEVSVYLQQPQVTGWTVRARDRFGDYGVVGAIYGAIEGSTFAIENVLFSCRVLGRGIERRTGLLLADALAFLQVQRCLIQAHRTARNVPATNFFQALTGQDAAVGSAECEVAAWARLPLIMNAAAAPPATATAQTSPSSAVAPTAQWDARWERWIVGVSQSASTIADAVWGGHRQGVEPDTVSRTEAERVALGFWRDVLGVSPAHPDDDFFAAGGTSLRLVRLVSAVNRHFGISLRLSDLYGNASVAALGSLIDARVGQQVQSATTTASSVPVLAPTQEGLWFIHNLNPAATAYLAAVAACVSTTLQMSTLKSRLHGLLRSDPVLASRYWLNGARTLVDIDPDADVALAETDASAWSLAQIVDHASALAREPIDLRRGPLLRVYLIHWSESRTILLLVSHHLVVDLKSLELTLGRLLNSSAKEPDARERADFWDFAARHRRELEGDSGQALRHDWSRRLSDPPPPLLERRFGTGRREEAGEFAVATASVDALLMQRLTERARTLETSTFLVLLSAYAWHCQRVFGRDDFIIGTPVSLRDDARHAQAIGNFVNTLPVRMRALVGDFPAVHAGVRAAFSDALTGKALPLHQISQSLGGGRSRVPLVQALFSFHADEGEVPVQQFCDHGQLSAPFRLGPLSCRILGLHQQVEQVDLAMETFSCDRGLGLNLKYNLACLESGQAQQFLRDFVSALGAVAVGHDRL